jgi:hypothetical protein
VAHVKVESLGAERVAGNQVPVKNSERQTIRLGDTVKMIRRDPGRRPAYAAIDSRSRVT